MASLPPFGQAAQATPNPFGQAAPASRATQMLKGHIAANPSFVLGGLVVLLVLVVFFWYKYSTNKKAKEGFQTLCLSNLNTGNNSPLWYLGGGDAGMYGAVGRPTTRYQAAVYSPGQRTPDMSYYLPASAVMADGRSLAIAKDSQGVKEGLCANLGICERTKDLSDIAQIEAMALNSLQAIDPLAVTSTDLRRAASSEAVYSNAPSAADMIGENEMIDQMHFMNLP
jgi:hypothetical protein